MASQFVDILVMVGGCVINAIINLYPEIEKYHFSIEELFSLGFGVSLALVTVAIIILKIFIKLIRK